MPAWIPAIRGIPTFALGVSDHDRAILVAEQIGATADHFFGHPGRRGQAESRSDLRVLLLVLQNQLQDLVHHGIRLAGLLWFRRVDRDAADHGTVDAHDELIDRDAAVVVGVERGTGISVVVVDDRIDTGDELRHRDVAVAVAVTDTGNVPVDRPKRRNRTDQHDQDGECHPILPSIHVSSLLRCSLSVYRLIILWLVCLQSTEYADFPIKRAENSAVAHCSTYRIKIKGISPEFQQMKKRGSQ